MARYVHPSVTDAEGQEESSVTLVVVPEEGANDRVQTELRDLSTTVEEQSLGILEVTTPSDAIGEIVEIEGIRSISSANVSMGDLGTGNPNVPPM